MQKEIKVSKKCKDRKWSKKAEAAQGTRAEQAALWDEPCEQAK